jgi:integrase/recombinase XerC
VTSNQLPSTLLPGSHRGFPVPAIIADAGEKVSEHFLEFFAATIRNPNTRAAYVEAAAQFFRWCEDYQLQLKTIRPLHVSAYIESKPLTGPSIKQHLGALRGLFNWLVIKQAVPDNPALFVKGPKFSRQVGITPILEPDQMRTLLDSIPLTRDVGLRRNTAGASRSWPMSKACATA